MTSIIHHRVIGSVLQTRLVASDLLPHDLCLLDQFHLCPSHVNRQQIWWILSWSWGFDVPWWMLVVSSQICLWPLSSLKHHWLNHDINLVGSHVHLTPFDGVSLDDANLYWQRVGNLIYLTVTRPDIAYVVRIISIFMVAPRTILTVILCLYNTLGHGLHFSSQSSLMLYKTLGHGLHIICYITRWCFSWWSYWSVFYHWLLLLFRPLCHLVAK